MSDRSPTCAPRVEAAVADAAPRDGVPLARRRSSARAQAELRRLRDERRDAARPGAAVQPPRDVAERLGGGARRRASATRSTRVEVAGPGFLNLFLADAWFARRARLGARPPATRSARAAPETPLHVNRRVRVARTRPGRCTPPATRHAAYGDALARMLAARRPRRRARVLRQRLRHARSSGSASRSAPARAARSRPRTATRATTSRDLAAQIAGRRRHADLADLARARRRAHARADQARRCTRFRVDFDRFFSERSLHEGSPVGHRARVRAPRPSRAARYRSDGALWLRTTEFGDDKDRVLERSTGEHTYFASDIAYHREQARARLRPLIAVWAPTTTATSGGCRRRSRRSAAARTSSSS